MPWFGLLNSDSETVAEDQVDNAKSLDDLEAGDGNASFPVEEGDTKASAQLLSTTPTPCSLNSSPSSSVSGAGTTEPDAAPAATSTVSFRPLQSSDRHRIQQLHEQWFPVSYSDDFYDDLVNNHRLSTSGDQLFTCVAILNDKNGGTSSEDSQLFCQAVGADSFPSQQQRQPQLSQQSQQEEEETVIGCAVGTFIHHSRLSPATSELLVPNSQQHSRLFYIMTLGTVEEYRNLGVATSLIQKCMGQVEQNKTCGALYLHVIPYNHAAIRFYEKLGFYRVSTIPDYYAIDDKNYDCYLYAKYYHGTCCTVCCVPIWCCLVNPFAGNPSYPYWPFPIRQSWASNIIQARFRRHIFHMASYKDSFGLVCQWRRRRRRRRRNWEWCGGFPQRGMIHYLKRPSRRTLPHDRTCYSIDQIG